MDKVSQPEVAKPSKKEEQKAQIVAILAKHKISAEAQAEILALFETKSGGTKVDPSEYTVFGDDGKTPAFILCPVTSLWFPAVTDHFYFNEDGALRTRVSKHGEKLKKELVKSVKASKDAILNDVINGEITPEEGKKRVADLDTLTIVIPEEVKAAGFESKPSIGDVKVPAPVDTDSKPGMPEVEPTAEVEKPKRGQIN